MIDLEDHSKSMEAIKTNVFNHPVFYVYRGDTSFIVEDVCQNVQSDDFIGDKLERTSLLRCIIYKVFHLGR